MESLSKPSPGIAEATCIDDKVECTGWAAQGECTTNSNYMRLACCKACELYAEAGSQKLSVLDDDRLLKAIAWSFAAVLAAASCIYWPATRRQILNLVMFSHGHQQHAGVRQLDGVPFDHYRVLQELGAGAFGTVSLVERVSDGKAFAAKEVLYSRCEHDEQWKAALDEVSVWTALCSTYHPSILQLVEVVHVENVSLHLVTELMSGGELAGALDHILMTEQNVRMIIVQIAAAIAHLHLSHSMAHRDIKPQNVLCRWRHNPMQAGCLSLADFGFCARFRGSPKEPCFSLYAGSMDYFAPELARIVRAVRGDSTRSPSECRACDCLNERCPPAPEWPQVRRKEPQEGMKYSAAVDCYALGCVVYQMFHGSTPHFSADEDEQLDKIVEGGLAYPREPFGQVQESADRMQHVLARDASLGPDARDDARMPLTLALGPHHRSQVSSSCLDFVQKLLEPDQQSRMTIEEAMRHKWLRSNS